eukprot:gene13934-9700_t
MCNSILRNLKRTIKNIADTARDKKREREKKHIWHMLMRDLPALKRRIRSQLVAFSPLVAVFEGEQLRAEAAFVEAAMHKFWVQRVFQQHPATTELPSPPPGYEEFVSGRHPCADAIAREMEQPLSTEELYRAIRKMNSKG